MTQVRKENSDSLEYVCPECGETFEEGSKECSSCGVEFDWSEELEYLCPECGTVVDPDQDRCPGCAAKFSKEENGDVTIEYEPDADPPTVEEMLEAAISEVTVHPVEKVSFGKTTYLHPAEVPEEGPVKMKDASSRKEGQAGSPRTASDAVDEGLALNEGPKRYPGGFTAIGILFVAIAILALVFTIVMARYDTWVQGAAEESMGENQKMLFYAGLVVFAGCIMVAVADLLRTPKGARGTD
jgi:predicted RNA-binding Zn-ribbon protein involved in translation (DUF1610 family)